MKLIKVLQIAILIVLALALSACTLQINMPAPSGVATTTGESFSGTVDYEVKDREMIDRFVGAEVPDFQMHTADRRLVSLREIGEPFLLNFLIVGCPACGAIYQSLEEAARQNNILAVHVFHRDTMEEIEDYLTGYEYELSDLILSGIDDMPNNTAVTLFNLYSFPTLFFVDAQGVIQHIEFSALHQEYLSELIQTHLK